MKELISEVPFFTPEYYKTTVRELFERKFKLIKVTSGKAEFSTQGKNLKANSGEYVFVTPGSFSRIKMIPALQKPFRMICLNISDKFIHLYLKQHPGGINTEGNAISAFEKLEGNHWLDALYASLEHYISHKCQPDETLIDIKLNECMYILKMKYKQSLFAAIETEKTPLPSLEEFIAKNYMFNAPMQRFAELSGRSLSSFRRECLRIWGMPPAKVIMEKRLEEAFRLLTQEKKRPSEIYCELGFETLAHFSRCFKMRYGTAPTLLSKQK